MADQMKPAYLIAGTDSAKIDQARSRLRQRAERDGGPGSLELFDPVENRGAPNVDAMLASLGAMSLLEGRRYLLADHVERRGPKQRRNMLSALESLPPATSVVLVIRAKDQKSLAKAAKPYAEAVRAAGGDVLRFDAPGPDQQPAYLIRAARERGFELSHGAAAFLIGHMGFDSMRLGNELDRLALWAGPGGSVEEADLESMVADTSEVSVFALGDALIAGDRERAVRVAEKLIEQGVNPASIVYPAATSLRRAQRAASAIDAGVAEARVRQQVGLPPSMARRLIASLDGTGPDRLRQAMIAIADLEIWTRGGASYPDDLALDMAVLEAVDGDAG